jgi:predicted 3-demethylubiquinone-9 3-methyltransferase (glyoxalase superfamily)
MARSAATHIMFQDGRAEQAMKFYVSLFSNSEITSIEKYGPNEPGAEGSIKIATFRIGGHDLLCIDSPVKHDFEFTPSISIFVNCDDEAELKVAFTQLSADGQVFMPLDNYGFSRQFGWVGDRFGVSWQLNLQ